MTIRGDGGIIKDSIKNKPITVITEQAIEKVPYVKIDGYTNEQCKFIQEQHKELLRYSHKNNEDKEVAFVLDRTLTKKNIVIGTDEKADLSRATYGLGTNITVLHNHPRNGSYSLQDTIFILSNPSVGSLTIVKNNGSVEVLQKTSTFDANELKTSLSRILKSTIKVETNSEYDKAIKKFLMEHSKKGGMFKWITS